MLLSKDNTILVEGQVGGGSGGGGAGVLLFFPPYSLTPGDKTELMS